MPIWLRRFTFEKIKEYYEKPSKEAENKKLEEAKNITKKIDKPNVYKVKAPKK